MTILHHHVISQQCQGPIFILTDRTELEYCRWLEFKKKQSAKSYVKSGLPRLHEWWIMTLPLWSNFNDWQAMLQISEAFSWSQFWTQFWLYWPLALIQGHIHIELVRNIANVIFFVKQWLFTVELNLFFTNTSSWVILAEIRWIPFWGRCHLCPDWSHTNITLLNECFNVCH